MQLPVDKIDWPEAWKLSYQYDQMEVYGHKKNTPYAISYANRSKSLIGSIQKYMKKGSTLIDLAAGSGNFTIALAEAGYIMYWNDLREELVPYVQMKQTSGSINYIPGNIFQLDQPPVDGVIISEIIEHVAHPDEFLKKVSTLVKPGGIIFLSTPLGNYFLNSLPRFSSFRNPEAFEFMEFKPNADGHIFLLHLNEIKKLGEQNGLKLISKKLNNNPLSAGHIKLHLLLKILPNFLIDWMECFTKKLPEWIALKIHANIVAVYQKVK